MLNLSKPIVGFDIDDVIFHLGPDLIKYYNLEYGTEKTLKDMRTMEEKKAYFIVEKYNLYKNMKATSIVPTILKKRQEIYLVFITARENKYADDTIGELYSHGLYFDDIFMGEKKSEVCKSEKVGHFFDDALHNIVDIRNNSTTTNSHLVEREWNDYEEFKRLNCNGNIKRLTEKEVCNIINSL